MCVCVYDAATLTHTHITSITRAHQSHINHIITRNHSHARAHSGTLFSFLILLPPPAPRPQRTNERTHQIITYTILISLLKHPQFPMQQTNFRSPLFSRSHICSWLTMLFYPSPAAPDHPWSRRAPRLRAVGWLKGKGYHILQIRSNILTSTSLVSVRKSRAGGVALRGFRACRQQNVHVTNPSFAACARRVSAAPNPPNVCVRAVDLHPLS